MESPLTMTEYGKTRGITRQTVSQYVRERKISQKAIVSDPAWRYDKIIPSIADLDLKKNLLTDTYPNAKENGKMVKGKTKPSGKRKSQAAVSKKSLPNNIVADEERDGLVQLKRKKEMVLLQKAALDLKQRKAELVETKVVYDTLFLFGKLLRDSILAIPDRVSADVFAAENQAEVNMILTKALEDSLRQLSRAENLSFDGANKN